MGAGSIQTNPSAGGITCQYSGPMKHCLRKQQKPTHYR